MSNHRSPGTANAAVLRELAAIDVDAEIDQWFARHAASTAPCDVMIAGRWPCVLTGEHDTHATYPLDSKGA